MNVLNGSGGMWRARVDANYTSFAQDQVRILLARTDEGGTRMATPATVELGETCAPYTATRPGEEPVPFLTLPTEAAEVLLKALAAHFCGTSDVVRLSRDLAAERKRVDALIAGIGRMSGGGGRMVEVTGRPELARGERAYLDEHGTLHKTSGVGQ